MPAKKKNTFRQINLVPREGLSSTTSGRIILWTLSTFRIILIITEIFVIGAFISRFWLDTKNSDLSEEMKQNKSIILSLSDFEKNFKDTQERLNVFNSYKIDKGIINSNLKKIVSYKPAGIYFKSVVVNLTGVNIDAVAIDEVAIQQYLVNLKASPEFENVSLMGISVSEENSVLNFTIHADVKPNI
jgi:Tfp pilus assembly protein PilN